MKENGTRLVGAGESAITLVLNAAVIIGTESGAGKVEGDGAIVVTHSGAGKGAGANNIAEGAIPATVAGAAVAATDLARGVLGRPAVLVSPAWGNPTWPRTPSCRLVSASMRAQL